MAQSFTHGELVSSPTEMTPADRDLLPPPVVKQSHTDISPLPVAPCKLARYERADNQYDSALCAQARRLTPPHDAFSVPVADHPIKPMMFCKPSEDQPDYSSQLWKRFIHPEGQVYYHSDDLQLVTDADATREDVHQAIMGTCKELRRQMNQILAHQRPDSETEELLWHHHHENWELCVEVVFDTDNLITGISYYIADWNRRCVMWLEEGLSGKAVGLEHHACDEHLRQDLEGQFWKHVEYFSAHRPLPDGAYEELKGILVYAGTDRMTSTDSTASFNATDIRSFLQLLQVECGDGPGQRYFTATVARHWHEACDNRVHHLYGLPGARLCRSQSRYYAPLATDNPGLFMRTVASVFLFNDPVRIYHKLCATYVDRSVCIDHWRTFLKGVQEDWRSNSVIATVMLAANMGFLAIGQLGGTGSVKTSGDVNADPSAQMPLPAQTLSAISALLSIGSIISGMLLVRRHRELDTPYCTADQAGEYMSECARQFNGLFGAAMHFSTPFALQLWCLILFVGAMLTYSFFTPSFIISPFIAFTVVRIDMDSATGVGGEIASNVRGSASAFILLARLDDVDTYSFEISGSSVPAVHERYERS
ncbi:hypothetical protein EXIGLDRAFT_767090 [Exidia glandulosa HHB12029]|uniref:WW domain-containing protein n=1 Tax=Exidia glandulosa HHB12029 TaxID=1314781 RepID=A0A165J7K5_EXIGL|nr:hypothetical protein EXIGLDRAFT_767090 [Exidia glandulosa HHB12029]